MCQRAFSGLYLENYISSELKNVTLTVLEGEVILELEDDIKPPVKLAKGSNSAVQTDIFHKVHTVSSFPSCFMYTYVNNTKANLKESKGTIAGSKRRGMRSPFPFLEDTEETVNGFLNMLSHIGNSFLYVFYDVPMVRRERIR